MTEALVLSHVQVEPILRVKRNDEPAALTSPDLGLSEVQVRIDTEGAVFPDGQHLAWPDLEAIAGAQNRCFVVEGGRPRPIEVFSEEDGCLYSLMPTEKAPTLLISGIPMHRIKGTDPWRDTLAKVRTVAPVVGRVLDTATGLGYTAIVAAKTADQVVTIEVSEATLQVARLNPWSRPLFRNPKIEQRVGDSYDVVEEMEDESFSRIIHDPPMFSLAGHLYSEAFYRELYRLLRRGGRVFHYIGSPDTKSGRGITRGVTTRLRQAGFERIVRRPEAFGVVAYK